jgi:uncharacterized membrane protein YbhN (UPF0104 family)
VDQLRGSLGRSIGLRCAGAATAAALVWWTFSGLDAARVGATLRAGGPALLWALLPMGVGFALESLGWAWAFRRFGSCVPLLGILRTRIASEALALTLPAGALLSESSTPFLLERHCGLRAEVSVAGMAVRKYLLLASQAVYISLAAWLGAAALEQASRELLNGPGLSTILLGLGALVFAAAVGVGLSLRGGRIAARVRAALTRLPWKALRRRLEQSRERFVATDDNLSRFFRGSLLDASTPGLCFFLVWTLEALETFLILRVLGIALPFEAVAALEVAVSFSRHMAFLLPGGLGVQDLAYVVGLRALGVAEPLAAGAAFVLIKRAKECTWALVGYALLAGDLRGLRAERAKRSSPAPRLSLSPG